MSFLARQPGKCRECPAPIEEGDRIEAVGKRWGGSGGYRHVVCSGGPGTPHGDTAPGPPHATIAAGQT